MGNFLLRESATRAWWRWAAGDAGSRDVLQEEHDELQDKFEEEMAALEKKYHDLQGAESCEALSRPTPIVF